MEKGVRRAFVYPRLLEKCAFLSPLSSTFMNIWYLRNMSKHLGIGEHQTWVYSGFAWMCFHCPFILSLVNVFFIWNTKVAWNLVCSECSTIKGSKEMCISRPFVFQFLLWKRFCINNLTLDQSLQVDLWKEFEFIGRDTRRWIEHSHCIQFKFGMGKRLDIGSSVIFVLVFWK